MKMHVQALGCGGGDYEPTHSFKKKKKSSVLTFKKTHLLWSFLPINWLT